MTEAPFLLQEIVFYKITTNWPLVLIPNRQPYKHLFYPTSQSLVPTTLQVLVHV